ncbi:alpha-ketoacid dehydrogenase subunit beta [Lentzea nigeriaca]|uniref:alpha-ketoacid dehydrogenase subunit beta n=1 Tax=Lentzea nigeriaca TaxID=1128665 RepID=UPI00195C0A1A|nr:alpha-ketoacid dehydrogenase subunit beta [Lentzea nigeriaca]MBM7856339.1 pyruvate dehydrogenase E1 component beta subunit [Lentzea nigeriaca]
MTRVLSYLQAVGEALRQEMQHDPSVVVFGEDNIGGTGCDGRLGNAWGPTQGLHEHFPDRVFDTPITEAAFVGAAVGAAATGLRPVADLLFVDFAGVCFDQILNQAAKLRYMTAGKARVPLVLRAMYGAGMRRGAQHSQVLYPIFAHVPGLKVVLPATPADAKGLMAAAIRDDDPVIFFEHKMLYFSHGEVPEPPYVVPLGQARIARPGRDCTIVALGRMVAEAEKAADVLAAEGIECEVVDPRTISPLDIETIYDSVRRTGHLVVADEATPRCGVAGDIAALVAEHAFHALRGPVRTVTAPHAPVPFTPALEDAYTPGADQIVTAVRATIPAFAGQERAS